MPALSTQPRTFALVPQVARAVKVPVIAAGGIADARGVAAGIALGAAGAVVGTAYLLCPEATTAPLHRHVLTSPHATHTALTNLFTGRTGPFLSRIAFVSDRSGAKELWVMRWDGSEAQQLTSHRSIALGPAWSPDGAHLAFSSFLAGRPGLYVLKPTEGTMMPLSEGAGVNSSPTFSPDGRTRSRSPRAPTATPTSSSSRSRVAAPSG